MNKTKMSLAVTLLTFLCFIIPSGCGKPQPQTNESSNSVVSFVSNTETNTFKSPVSDQPYAVVNNNKPLFNESEITTISFEKYSDLDELGRCGTAIACVGQDIMPTEKRGSIGMVKPTGWHTVKYDFIDGKYLYNRCHLIGYQLTGENANEKNLITGTRYLNVEGMLPFENQVADYVKETGNHVMYRVIPEFTNDNLLANGVYIEGLSVEDNGEGISFNVFVYNMQPGVKINYTTGESQLDKISTDSSVTQDDENTKTYIINKNTKKFHTEDCENAKSMLPKNRKEYKGTAKELIDQGYTPCQTCNQS